MRIAELFIPTKTMLACGLFLVLAVSATGCRCADRWGDCGCRVREFCHRCEDDWGDFVDDFQQHSPVQQRHQHHCYAAEQSLPQPY